MNNPVLCVGEVLWDVFPTGQYLGGAPLNVAYHLHSIGRPAAIASRIGNDALGGRTLQRLADIGLETTLLQIDPALPTGRVEVRLVDAHTPQYDIKAPAAWDAIEAAPALMQAAGRARAIVFGSLAQRDERSRRTIQALLAPGQAMRVFDVNLRPPFIDPEQVSLTLRSADFLKLNDQEWATFREWYRLPAADSDAAEEISRRFGCRTICVTYGAEGAALWVTGQWHAFGGYRVTAVDPVGAGDAFLAGLLDGLLRGTTPAEALARACAIGAFVATQPSSTPPLDLAAIDRLRQSAASSTARAT